MMGHILQVTLHDQGTAHVLRYNLFHISETKLDLTAHEQPLLTVGIKPRLVLYP